MEELNKCYEMKNSIITVISHNVINIKYIKFVVYH